MSRVVHFEINEDDPTALAEFYREAFDWTIQKWEGPVDYWLVSTGEEDQPGINGAITHRRSTLREHCEHD